MELIKRLGRIAILGAQGQVGRAALNILGTESSIALSRNQADLCRVSLLLEALEKYNPDAVFNAAAYTQVDLAEKEAELARNINSEAPAALARWCAKRDIPFVHFSTDYVFSGEGTTPWREEDRIAPLSIYGQTKAEGEKAIQEAGGRFLIFRTSWVYDAHGKNFLNTMLKLGKDRETLKIVNDQYGAPTFAPDLAGGALEALTQSLEMSSFPSGIYHLCNEGETTWYQFAQAIFDLAKERGIPLKIQELIPIPSSEYPTPARRPQNSRLSTEKFYTTFGFRLPSWQNGLEMCIREVP